jgi:Tn3 transposase DDE domain
LIGCFRVEDSTSMSVNNKVPITHLKTGEPAKDLEPILAAILADGTNLGLSKMAGASADS